jgi:hypothetical protein
VAHLTQRCTLIFVAAATPVERVVARAVQNLLERRWCREAVPALVRPDLVAAVAALDEAGAAEATGWLIERCQFALDHAADSLQILDRACQETLAGPPMRMPVAVFDEPNTPPALAALLSHQLESGGAGNPRWPSVVACFLLTEALAGRDAAAAWTVPAALRVDSWATLDAVIRLTAAVLHQVDSAGAAALFRAQVGDEAPGL